MSAIITVAGLTKRYGTHTALDGVDFVVEAGTIFGLLGPNGAGKTSVLECLAGLRRADGGSVVVDGVDVRAEPERARGRLGVALQDTALQDRITPRESLRLFGAFYQTAPTPDALLVRFSLGEKADSPYESLSAGQKQRLALALAFVPEPAVLLLDEPTAGLDPGARRDLHREILRLRDEGRTVLLTTHLLDEAHALCDRVAILRGGRIAAVGPPAELIARDPRRPRITLRTAGPVPLDALRSLEGVTAVGPAAGGVEFEAAHVGRAVTAVVGLLERQGNELLDLRVWRPSLDDAFARLTGDASAP